MKPTKTSDVIPLFIFLIMGVTFIVFHLVLDSSPSCRLLYRHME